MITSLSGIQASRLRMDVSANNVANMMTPGFRASRVALSGRGEMGGVDAKVMETDEPPELAREMVEQIEAGYSMKANGQVVKIKSDMQKSLLDILA